MDDTAAEPVTLFVVGTLSAIGVDCELGGKCGNTGVQGREDDAHGETALDEFDVEVAM